jgi:hypothetical protein
MIRVLSPAVLLVLTFFASVAPAGVGNPEVTYEMAYQGSEPVCLLVIPDGSGPRLTEARTFSGLTVDATINVRILDLALDPIVSYPPEDVWLEAAGEELAICAGGSVADAPTDADGRTTISGPLLAGGWSESGAVVFVAGWSPSQPPVVLTFNSPDLDGDREVNLSDVQLFATDYYDSSYHHRSDLHYDGRINLADIVPLANAFGTACP